MTKLKILVPVSIYYRCVATWRRLVAGYEDNGAYWRSWYESDTFRQDCERLWIEVRPLYEQLHAYVRRKLQERYPTGTFPAEGHIPAHLLGELNDVV